jgi:hypothetical protein
MNFVAVFEQKFLGFTFLYVIFSLNRSHCQYCVTLGKPLCAGEGHKVDSVRHEIVCRNFAKSVRLVIIFPLCGDASTNQWSRSSLSCTKFFNFFLLQIFGV